MLTAALMCLVVDQQVVRVDFQLGVLLVLVGSLPFEATRRLGCEVVQVVLVDVVRDGIWLSRSPIGKDIESFGSRGVGSNPTCSICDGFSFRAKGNIVARKKKMTFEERVERSSERRGAKGIRGPFLDALLPIIIQFLQNCLAPKPVPTPQPATSTATPESWKIADEAKTFAIGKIKSGNPTAEHVEYKKTVTNAAKRRIMKEKRHSDDRMTGDEATAAALGFLDQARLGDLEENAQKIDETKVD